MTSSSFLPAVGLLDPARFQCEVDGKPVRFFALRNALGMAVGITNYGARIEQILVPDRHGRFDDVVLGCDSLEGVLGGAPSMGAFVGRYASGTASQKPMSWFLTMKRWRWTSRL